MFSNPHLLNAPTQFARFFNDIDVMTVWSLHYYFPSIWHVFCINLTTAGKPALLSHSHVYVMSTHKETCFCLMIISYPFAIWLKASYVLATFMHCFNLLLTLHLHIWVDASIQFITTIVAIYIGWLGLPLSAIHSLGMCWFCRKNY